MKQKVVVDRHPVMYKGLVREFLRQHYPVVHLSWYAHDFDWLVVSTGVHWLFAARRKISFLVHFASHVKFLIDQRFSVTSVWQFS